MLLVSHLLTLFLSALAIAVLIPITVLLSECLLALLPDQPSPPSPRLDRSPTIAVLMPAHNEALGIGSTLQALSPQIRPPDRLVVIADNCEDATAAIARATGVIVTERCDTERQGKGYALQHGLQLLAPQPPDVVIIVDADCQVTPGGLSAIAQQAIVTGCPVQAQYLMAPPPEPSPRDSLSALAFTLKNSVRPRGLHRLGLPCLLTGTGMAFPWPLLQQIAWVGDHLVEDMQLSVDAAIAGCPPQFCPRALVTSTLPQQQQAATTQRTRWEHGHLQTIRSSVPRLLREALRQRRLELLALALDLSVPPLSLLMLLWLGAFILALGAWSLGIANGLPALGLAIAGGMLTLAISIAGLGFARDQVSWTLLLAIPRYILWKIPLYLAFLIRPQSQWVRTARDSGSGSPAQPPNR